MHSKLHVLLASRSKPVLTELAARFGSQATYKIDTRHIENGHADPLWGLSFVPDVVVMFLNERGHEDMSALVSEQSAGRPPLIVVAKDGNAQTMRLAMQAGARDFLAGVVTFDELVASLERVSAQVPKHSATSASALTVFVNAKGGSGATFVACNVAHILAAVSEQSTALLSLDLQFESLAQYFDTNLRHNLLQVLDAVDELDDLSLDAYMTQHGSGLRMLGAQSEKVTEPNTEKAPQLELLLEKMGARYGHVLVDMPRRLNAYSVPVLQRASRVVLVVQQTLSHLRDATRMMQILAFYGVRNEKVLVVVNRYEKNSAISVDDIKRSLHGTEVVVVPSDFKTVADSINLGAPMYEHARGSAVTKALIGLEAQLGGSSRKAARGIFGKAFSNFLRKES